MTRVRVSATALTVALLVLFVGPGVWAVAAAVAPAPPSTPTPFDAKSAIAALGSRSILRMAGAPASFDQAQISGRIRGTDVKLLLVPFQPYSAEADREAERAQESIVGDWGDAHHVQVILVIGLEIHLLSKYVVVTPDNLTELRPVLENYDLTVQLQMSLDLLRNSKQDEPVATTAAPAAPRALPAAAVTAMVQRLRVDDTAVVGDIPLTKDPQKLWRDSIPRQRLRLVIEPPPTGDPGELAKPLSARFPGDVVIVIRGRWIEIAGPDQALLDSAVLYSYGAAAVGFTAWAVTPDLYVNYLAQRIALLRSGSVSGQASPAAAPDPVRSVGRSIPILVAATALMLVLVLLVLRRRRAAGLRESARSAARTRDRVAGRLPGVAAGILALDGLAQSGAAHDLLDSATERYGVARTIVLTRGNGDIAGAALDAATAQLRNAASLLKVPLPAFLEPDRDDAGRDDAGRRNAGRGARS